MHDLQSMWVFCVEGGLRISRGLAGAGGARRVFLSVALTSVPRFIHRNLGYG